MDFSINSFSFWGQGETQRLPGCRLTAVSSNQLGWWLLGSWNSLEACWAPDCFKMSCAESQPLQTPSAWSGAEVK